MNAWDDDLGEPPTEPVESLWDARQRMTREGTRQVLAALRARPGVVDGRVHTCGGVPVPSCDACVAEMIERRRAG